MPFYEFLHRLKLKIRQYPGAVKSLTDVVRKIGGGDHRKFHQTADAAIWIAPGRLIDDLMYTILLDSVCIALACGKHVMNHFRRLRRMAIVKIPANEITVRCKRLACLTIHIQDNAVGIAHCHGTIKALRPSIIIHNTI